MDTFDDDWEEWDGKSPFWVHCVAGSVAGVAEHVLVYPLDTVRTHIQVCAACNFNPATHNASTQAAGVAAGNFKANGNANAAPIGSVLQQAAASATNASGYQNQTAVCKTKAAKLNLASVSRAAAAGSSSSSISNGILAAPLKGPLGGGAAAAGVAATTAATTTTTAAAGNGMHNLSMLQAIRQLVSQKASVSSSGATAAAALDTAAATTTTTTAGIELPRNLNVTRLWRGVQTILIGCIPAHALYFSTYEIVKAATLDKDGNVTAYGSALAGGAAVFGHDIVLGPLDTVKQRLQLGHYNGLTDALQQMIKNEGAVSLLRSFPVTLATNIPYGMIMVGTNEFLKDQWTRIKVDDDGDSTSDTSDNNDNTQQQQHHHIDHSELTLGVTLGASSLAGLVAAATTTPLDRIKTYLQTQQLAPKCLLQPTSSSSSLEHCPLNGTSSSSGGGTAATQHYKPIVANWRQAALRIYKQEGYAGFFRGLTPRILSHTPAVAISWTTYEAFKRYLQRHFCDE